MNVNIGKPAKPQHWLGLLALFTFLGWIIPNHHRPWTAFHAEAWLGAGFLIFGAQVIWRGGPHWRLNVPLLMVLLLLLLPFIQFSFGMVPWMGQVWVSTLYLLGFWIAMVVGFNTSIEHENEGCDFIFLIVTLAGVISVGFQLLQWFGNDIFGIWLMDTGKIRPSANFGQPNQLATLLLLAVAGAGWWWQKKLIGVATAALLIGYFLIGVALTQSRAAFLSVSLLTICFFIYFVVDRRIKFLCFSLLPLAWLCFCLYIKSLDYSFGVSGGVGGGNIAGRLTETSRPQIWRFFLDAALEKPWFGYGWNQTGRVQVDLALSSPITGVHFGSAHNIALDLMLWIGMPLTALVLCVMVAAFARVMPYLNRQRDLPILICIFVVGVHAMVEFPLSYAYFLVPVGYFMGVLFKRRMTNSSTEVFLPKWSVSLLWIGVLILYSIIVTDYLSVERRYNEMLFEKARIGTNHPQILPNVIVLNDLQALIKAARVTPVSGASNSDLELVLKVVRTFPSAGNFFLLAQMYALNDRREDAHIWLAKGCVLVTRNQCDSLRLAWDAMALQKTEFQGIFPVDTNISK